MKQPQQRPLGAQISHMLKDRGVDVIFGIPGVHNQEMYRGIEEAGITHVLARHEQGAGFMADGYARATGRPGVAYVITGPGVCNIMTPMGQAYSDSVPMLVISSCLDEVAAKKGQLHQMLDQEGAAACVCDWSETARTAEAAYQLIDRAFLEISTQRPRPKHIQVPIAALVSQAGQWKKMRAQPQALDEPTMAIDAAERFLANAKRPLFIFGGGVWQKDAPRKVVRQSGAASFITYAGRGVIAAEDPLHYGAFLARPDSVAEISKADAVIAVGTTLAEVDLWRTSLGQNAPLLRIDIDPSVLADLQGASMGYDCNSASFLTGLARRLEAKPPAATDWTPEEVALARAKWRAETDAERPGIVPICDALRAAVPPGTMIYSDMTQIAYVAKEVWDMDRPGHWHHPYGFGTLGYALPAGIGGAVGRPGLPTMVIAGDYGFQYTMQELGVAVELGLPIPIILWDNGKLKEIEDSMVRAQIAPNAVIARNPDFCKLAEAFGAGSAAPQTLAEMQAAVQAAFKADGPTLIHITPEIVA
ncbi:MAG: thiamine pyrophosphate-dependent enzyme [Rhodobacteraceae bacterium]|nr:thiamine pyrophosphate-dependent enzyme [Paracoccaceae bacterium]